MDYLPNVVALRAAELSAQGRTLHNLVAGGLREGNLWRANLDASELNGYVEFRQPAAGDMGNGRLFARLSRLSMPQSEATQVENLLAEQPGSLPAVDVVVDDFELRGRKLGRIEIEAQNRSAEGAQREWRLGKFNITTPEASLTATGNWALLSRARAWPSRAAPSGARRSTSSSTSATRATCWRVWHGQRGAPGQGRMEGQVGWIGAPFSPTFAPWPGRSASTSNRGSF
jgi:uncharacterized protein YhdP